MRVGHGTEWGAVWTARLKPVFLSAEHSYVPLEARGLLQCMIRTCQQPSLSSDQKTKEVSPVRQVVARPNPNRACQSRPCGCAREWGQGGLLHDSYVILFCRLQSIASDSLGFDRH